MQHLGLNSLSPLGKLWRIFPCVFMVAVVREHMNFYVGSELFRLYVSFLTLDLC